MGVYRNYNLIEIDTLDQPVIVSRFLTEVQNAIRAGYDEIEVDFSQIQAVFPNAAVPISGLIEYFKESGITINRVDDANIISSIYLFNPTEPISQDEVLSKNVLNKIWRFTSYDKVFWLVNAFIEELSKQDQFETGVLNGLEWCLNEVMDNVIQHSTENCGFVMGQLHKSSKHVAFTVFDYGQGIFNSLKNSVHAPRYPLDAITLCIKEGITRDKNVGQGNGMYGLHQIVKFNKGSLAITSNNASYFLRREEVNTFVKIPSISKQKGCTTVDFQLDYDNNVSIADALNFNGTQYDMVNLRIENLKNSYGEILYLLKDKANGYGTRQSGERVRNELLNIYQEGGKVLIIDFEGIAVISSSFADELIGKLVVEFGFFGFNNIVRLKNMSTLVQSIIHRSVSQRMAESVNK